MLKENERPKESLIKNIEIRNIYGQIMEEFDHHKILTAEICYSRD